MSKRLSKHQRPRPGMVRPIKWLPDGFPHMQSIVKPGAQGDVTISHFTVTKTAADSFNAALYREPATGHLVIEPGKFVRMHVGPTTADNLMMSDTAMERRSNRDIKNEAHGRVLIAGLGIGMILHPLLDPERTHRKRSRWEDSLPKVDHVTVVEKNPDVIALIAPTLLRYNGRLDVVQADIFEFDPKGEKYNTIYFDIWPHIDAEENLPQIAQLHQRWKGRLIRDGERKPWMSSWMVDILRMQREMDRRQWGWML